MWINYLFVLCPYYYNIKHIYRFGNLKKDAQLLNMMVLNLQKVDNILGLTARKQRHKLTFFKTERVAWILGLPVQLCLIHRQCLLCLMLLFSLRSYIVLKVFFFEKLNRHN